MSYLISEPFSELQADLHTKFTEFETAMQSFKNALRAEKNIPCWAWGYDDPVHAHSAIINIIGQINYVDGQKKNETLSLAGLAAVSRQTCIAGQILNQSKKRLQKACQAMDKKSVRITDDYTNEPVVTTLISYALRKMGKARFNRIQASRQLILFDEPPKYLGFTWAHTTKPARLSIPDALAKVQRKGEGANIDHDTDLLEQLPPDEILAHVLKSPTHERANILIKDREAKSGTRWIPSKACPLPILYINDDNKNLIPFGSLMADNSPDPNRKTRSDIKIASTRLLKSMPVFRYLPQFRDQVAEEYAQRISTN